MITSDLIRPQTPVQDVQDVVDSVYRVESRRVLAALIRLLGNFDLAEDALHDAFRAALEQWSQDGVPANPRAWLISTGRFKAIDQLRRTSRAEPLSESLAEHLAAAMPWDQGLDPESPEDDRLRLIFTCCHPALSPEARVALTLREVCDLTTEAIAHAFLIAPSALAQRIVRAKAKIREAGIPFEVPPAAELPERLEAVLQVIYLVFNEGYLASSGEAATRPDLSQEAIRLGRLLLALMPDPEVKGLLALMLLHESRRRARISEKGDLVLLENQDRSLWDRNLIGEGSVFAEQAFASGRIGPYAIQAAIAAVHAQAPEAAATDWDQIVGLYNLLLAINPSPIVELNRAVALAMRDGPSAGLKLIEGILARGELSDYSLAHSARGELCRRLGRMAEARASFKRALGLTHQEPARRFLGKRLLELSR